jgi:hypothetical protein
MRHFNHDQRLQYRHRHASKQRIENEAEDREIRNEIAAEDAQWSEAAEREQERHNTRLNHECPECHDAEGKE